MKHALDAVSRGACRMAVMDFVYLLVRCPLSDFRPWGSKLGYWSARLNTRRGLLSGPVSRGDRAKMHCFRLATAERPHSSLKDTMAFCGHKRGITAGLRQHGGFEDVIHGLDQQHSHAGVLPTPLALSYGQAPFVRFAASSAVGYGHRHVSKARLEALERDGVLADEFVADEVVVQHHEAHHRELGEVDLKLEALVEQRVVPVLVDRFSPLLGTVGRNAVYFHVHVGVYYVSFGTGAFGFGEVLSADDLDVQELWRNTGHRIFSVGTEIGHVLPHDGRTQHSPGKSLAQRLAKTSLKEHSSHCFWLWKDVGKSLNSTDLHKVTRSERSFDSWNFLGATVCCSAESMLIL
ncbi:hypothetical protein EYF80_055934 [Liparis tanakae]|uniref:Uncharacterized protein n=1 Tax=Liparis tanakae TaxID=230148 RepID=A0A4Z2EYE3_9TELE|nr:hypothetical protein EYF80_055934 [Liparis tanakae]